MGGGDAYVYVCGESGSWKCLEMVCMLSCLYGVCVLQY